MSGCSGPVELNSNYLQTLKWHNLSGQHISVFDPSHCGIWICSYTANMSFPTWKLCWCLLLCTYGSGLALSFPYNISLGSWRMQSALPLPVFSSGYTNCSLSFSSRITCSIPLIFLVVLHCSSPIWQCLSCTGESKLEITTQMQCHGSCPDGSNHFLQPVGCSLPNAAQYVMQNTTHSLH